MCFIIYYFILFEMICDHRAYYLGNVYSKSAVGLGTVQRLHRKHTELEFQSPSIVIHLHFFVDQRYADLR